MNPDFTQGERNVYKSHIKQGIKLLHERGMQDKDILRTIAQHHEFNDGSGFPNKLIGNQITQAAQIVAIADMYDSLCNPRNSVTAVSPHEAVSVMYNKYKPKFNSDLLSNFINSVGIYPPGSIVQLSSQSIGMVLSVDPGKLLHPNVLIYDQQVSRNKAIIINLQDEQDLSITSGLNAKEVSPEVREYLNPGLSAYYYFDSI